MKTDAMINPDPFCPVRMSNIEHNGTFTDKYMVEVQKPETEEFSFIPGVSTVHTRDYQLVSNRDVFDMATEVLDATDWDFEPVPAYGGGHSKAVIWNGKRFSAKWYSKDVSFEGPSGSSIMLGVEAQNSYDGSCKVGLAFFAMHLVCSNQFYSTNLLGKPFTLPHVNRGGLLSDDISDVFGEIKHQATDFAMIQPKLQSLQNTHVDSFNDFLELRQDMAEKTRLEFKDKAILDELTGCGVSAKLNLPEQAAYNDPTSYWAIANAYTAVTTHAMQGARGADHSRRAVDYLLKHAHN